MLGRADTYVLGPPYGVRVPASCGRTHLRRAAGAPRYVRRRVPAAGVPYVPRTVWCTPQVLGVISNQRTPKTREWIRSTYMSEAASLEGVLLRFVIGRHASVVKSALARQHRQRPPLTLGHAMGPRGARPPPGCCGGLPGACPTSPIPPPFAVHSAGTASTRTTRSACAPSGGSTVTWSSSPQATSRRLQTPKPLHPP